jgi:hypothetical protein
VNANLNLIPQWSPKKRSYSWQRDRKTQNLPLPSSKRGTRLFKLESPEKYHKELPKNEKRPRPDQKISRLRPDPEEPRYRPDREVRDYPRSVRIEYDTDRPPLKDRYLKENRTTEKYREMYRQELVTTRPIYNLPRPRSLWKNSIPVRSRYEGGPRYSIPANESRVSRQFLENLENDYDSRQFSVSRSRSPWKNPISASSLWKDAVSARSRYDNDSQYCIRFLYLSENDLSEDD